MEGSTVEERQLVLQLLWEATHENAARVAMVQNLAAADRPIPGFLLPTVAELAHYWMNTNIQKAKSSLTDVKYLLPLLIMAIGQKHFRLTITRSAMVASHLSNQGNGIPYAIGTLEEKWRTSDSGKYLKRCKQVWGAMPEDLKSRIREGVDKILMENDNSYKPVKRG